MASHGIKDRVAIVGMGCTPFTEAWDKGLDDLSLNASQDAFAAAGITKDDVDAYWLGTAQSGMSGITVNPSPIVQNAARRVGANASPSTTRPSLLTAYAEYNRFPWPSCRWSTWSGPHRYPAVAQVAQGAGAHPGLADVGGGADGDHEEVGAADRGVAGHG